MSALALTTVLIHSIETWKKKDRAGKSLSDHFIHPRHFTDGEIEVHQGAATSQVHAAP